MKANKAPDAGIEVSPSQKKLKQARLPFKLISEIVPVSDNPNSRKRKLSAQENDTASKVGKISKENGIKDDLVVISDDEGKTDTKSDISSTLPNPYVKLVDTAIKKKLQKTKTPKKRKNNKKKETVMYDCVEVESSDGCMDVDEPVNTENNNKSPSKAATETITSTGDVTADNTDMANIKSVEPESKDNKNNANKTVSINIESETIEQSQDNDSTEKNIIESPPNIIPVTPKRSSRSQMSKPEDKTSLDKSTPSSRDESMSSNPCTPKQKLNTSIGGEDSNESNKSLTPRQVSYNFL